MASKDVVEEMKGADEKLKEQSLEEMVALMAAENQVLLRKLDNEQANNSALRSRLSVSFKCLKILHAQRPLEDDKSNMTIVTDKLIEQLEALNQLERILNDRTHASEENARKISLELSTLKLEHTRILEISQQVKNAYEVHIQNAHAKAAELYERCRAVEEELEAERERASMLAFDLKGTTQRLRSVQAEKEIEAQSASEQRHQLEEALSRARSDGAASVRALEHERLLHARARAGRGAGGQPEAPHGAREGAGGGRRVSRACSRTAGGRMPRSPHGAGSGAGGARGAAASGGAAGSPVRRLRGGARPVAAQACPQRPQAARPSSAQARTIHPACPHSWRPCHRRRCSKRASWLRHWKCRRPRPSGTELCGGWIGRAHHRGGGQFQAWRRFAHCVASLDVAAPPRDHFAQPKGGRSGSSGGLRRGSATTPGAGPQRVAGGGRTAPESAAAVQSGACRTAGYGPRCSSGLFLALSSAVAWGGGTRSGDAYGRWGRGGERAQSFACVGGGYGYGSACPCESSPLRRPGQQRGFGTHFRVNIYSE